MHQQKNRRLSLYEIVRARLGLRKFEMARALGITRMAYTRKCNPSCLITASDLARLYNVSQMTPREFIEAIREVGEGESSSE